MSQMQGIVNVEQIENELSAIAGLINVSYDTTRVTYTDATKENISTVEYFSGGTGGVLMLTLTVTYPTATTEVYTNL